jgi:glyoxylase-like metal-dependent hydrolase (beta-lactamase superfamily II)
MIVERSMNEDFLSNTYLVVNEDAGEAFFVDAGGPVKPLMDKAEELGVTPTHVLLTHRHGDHVQELPLLLDRWPDMAVLAHPEEQEGIDGITGDMEGDQELDVAGLKVSTLHTPGHTSGMLALVVEGNVFTGDTLFKNSVGGVRAPGSTSYEDLKRSVMEVLLALPDDTVIRPGHTDPTTVADEKESNAFVRVWNGVDDEGDEQVTVWDKPATLVLWGNDYDGGHKAWIRWEDGADDIVGGSQVQRS